MSTFTEKVLNVVGNISKGNVMSYAAVAKAAGNPRAARAVGTIMKANTNKKIPCHRVIRSNGSVGEYSGLRGKSKYELLKKEGVKNIKR